MLKRNRFAARITALILTAVVSVGFFASSPESVVKVDAAKTLAQLQEEQKALQKKIASVNSNIASSKNNIKKEKEYQAAINQKIELTEENIQILFSQIDSLNESIDSLEKSIGQQQESIDKGMEAFRNRLRAMYMSDGDNYAAVLAGSTDFYDFLARMEIVERVSKRDDEMIDELNEKLDRLEEDKLAVEQQKADTETAKAELEAQKQELSDAYDQSTSHQAELEAAYQSYLKNKAALDAEEEKAEQAIRDEIARLASTGGTFTGEFMWPVPGYTYVSSGYGTRWGKLHKGIDIAGGTIAGKPIVASAAGTVIVASATCSHNYPKQSSCGCGSGYGNYVMIDHGNGYVTLYGHCQSLAVKAGDKVNQGQTIAYVGTTGYSTGYHCHFEIRKNGSPVNPRQFV